MNYEDTIKKLSSNHAPVVFKSQGSLFFGWLFAVIVSFALVFAVHGLRPDFANVILNNVFVAELLLNVAMVILSGLLTIKLSYPVATKTKLVAAGFGLMFVAYSSMVLFAVSQTNNLSAAIINSTPHGLECLLCIISFAFMPAIYMFFVYKKMATIKPKQLCFAVLFTSTAIGCLGVRLVESEVVTSGLVVWHYLPLIVISGLGFLLGNKFFKW